MQDSAELLSNNLLAVRLVALLYSDIWAAGDA